MASAYFVYRPRTVAELRRPHLLSDEREYEIADTVLLPRIDYENFITDLLVTRDFLEEGARICSSGAVMHCLLVRVSGCAGDDILAVPDSHGNVLWAAISEK